MVEYKNPKPTVDAIIEVDSGIVLIKRLNEPIGWALPGGFVDEGESNEHACVREAMEEVNININLTEQMYTYSDPNRDPRQHNLTTVFIANSNSPLIELEAKDDADDVGVFSRYKLVDMIKNNQIVLGHDRFINDYIRLKNGEPRSDVFNPMDDIKTN